MSDLDQAARIGELTLERDQLRAEKALLLARVSELVGVLEQLKGATQELARNVLEAGGLDEADPRVAELRGLILGLAS